MPRTRQVVAVLVLVGAALGALPSAALAATAPVVELLGPARATSSGTAVLALRVTCAPEHEVLEAHVTLTQDSTTATTGLAVRCTGRPDRVRAVLVPLDGQFQDGPAQASAFVLVLEPATSTTAQGQDSGSVVLR